MLAGVTRIMTSQFRIPSEFHDFSMRNQLGDYLNKHGLTGNFVEVGVLFGAYSEIILKSWDGHLHCVDPWINQDDAVYLDGANKLNMETIYATARATIGSNPRCTLHRMMSLNAVGLFDDGELDGVYLDGNHALPSVRSDILCWWPKVKIGGIVSGHDFFTRYDNDTNSDALTAVMELSEIIGVRPHITWDTSWWFTKTADADMKFRQANIEGRFEQPVFTNNNGIHPVVVLPVARFDWNLAVKWLRWVGNLDCPLVVYCSPQLTEGELDNLDTGGRVVVANELKECGYFGTPNGVIKGALEYCEKNYSGRAVIWCEADTVPMCHDWVEKIMDEYSSCGRPFLGDVELGGTKPHLTGNAVYHPNWRKLAPSIAALGKEAEGWDSLCAHDTMPRSRRSLTIQQIWRPKLPITAEWAKENIHPTTALFHQCKDGSLIDVLCQQQGMAIIPLAKALCESTYETQRTQLVAKPTPVPVKAPVVVTQKRADKQAMEILIVTFKRDMEFLRYCLLSIAKYATDFSVVTLVVPQTERGLYDWTLPQAKVCYFDEPPGKGMLAHEREIMRADEWCPNARYILHLDADCMFWNPTTPADFLRDGKAFNRREAYSNIGNPNRHIWSRCVDKFVGVEPRYDYMLRHPQVHIREVYAKARSEIERHTARVWDTQIMAGQNTFPQTFAEFPTLGAIADKFFHEFYHWEDYDKKQDRRTFGIPDNQDFQFVYTPNRNHVVEFWSHGGLGYRPAGSVETYREMAEKFLRGELPQFYLK